MFLLQNYGIILTCNSLWRRLYWNPLSVKVYTSVWCVFVTLTEDMPIVPYPVL